jgi:hypothetical protein
MGCSPSKNSSGIVEVRRDKQSGKSTGQSFKEDASSRGFKNISASLFMINEVNSKYEDSAMPSNIGTLMTPQKTENFKDN